MRLSRLVRRLLLVVDYVLRVLRKIIVCVDSIEGDLASRRLFCALCYSLQRSTQTPDPVNLVGHLSLRGMRVKQYLASHAGRQCPTHVVIGMPKRYRGGLYRSGMANRFSSEPVP